MTVSALQAVTAAQLAEEYLAGATLEQLAQKHGYANATGPYNKLRRAGFAHFRRPVARATGAYANIGDDLVTDYVTDDWGTPPHIVHLVRRVLGTIDVDPASNDAAQQVIQATTYYTKQTNGLDKPWRGTVWLNMPYSMPLVDLFSQKVLEEIDNGNCTAAIVLTNNATETGWYKRLALRLPQANSRQRIQFVHPERGSGRNRQAQTFFYHGPDVLGFYRTFDRVAYPPVGTMLALTKVLRDRGQITLK